MTTETNASRRPIGQTLWRYIRILLGVVIGGFLLVHVSCVMSELGTGERLPRYVYTETRTELVFDGEKIVIKGVAECRRRSGTLSNGQSLNFGKPTPLYNCRPQWFAHPLESGGVLLVGTYAISDSWPPLFGSPDLSQHEEKITQRPRAVMWIGDPQFPTRGESYYSTIYMEQPQARLNSIKTELVSVNDRTYFPRPFDNPAEHAPWLDTQTSETALRAYYAILVPKRFWSLVPDLERILSNYTEPVLLNAGDLLSKDQRRELHKAAGFARVYTLFEMETDIAHPKSHAGQRFDQSSRVVPLIREADGAYRLDRSQPRGVIYSHVSPYRKTVIVNLDDNSFEMPTNEFLFWFIYDPATEELIAFGP